MSLFPNDEDDDTIPSDWEKVESSDKKKRSRRKKKKPPLTKICETCGQDILENEKRDMYMHHDTYHRLKVKEYCDAHEVTYSGHKCKPHWCMDCGYLIKYVVEIDHSKWDK